MLPHWFKVVGFVLAFALVVQFAFDVAARFKALVESRKADIEAVDA